MYITSSSPKVNSAEASSTIVASGTNVKLTATANNATKVKFVDADSSAVIAEVKEYIDNADGSRTFETNYIPNNTQGESVVKNIYAYAGNNSGYIESLADAGKITLMITAAEDKEKDKDKEKDDDEDKKSEYLVKYKLESKSVEKGDYARISVTTTDDISRVKVTNSFSSTKAEQSQYEEDKDDQRVFDLKLKTTSRGSQSLYIYLYVEADKDYDSAYETVPIKVDYEDEDDEDYGDLDIIDVEVYPDTIYKGETAYITVYTTKDIEEVAIFDEDDDRVVRQLYETDTLNNKKVWELDFEVKHSDKQKYTVTGYNDDDEEATDNFRITGESYSSADLLVLSVIQKSSDIVEGDSAKFDARCTSSTSYIIVTDSNGKELKKVTSGSKDGSIRKFSFNIEIEDIDDNYYVYAYNSDGSQKNSYKFKPRGTEEDELEIKDIEVKDSSKIYREDDVYVTVYTSTNVSKIWIEDEEEERVSKRMSKPDEETSSSYIWELEFEAEEKGRVTYTVIVEDDNDNTLDESFNITVKK